MAFEKLLSPVRIGSVQVRNRTVMTAHGATDMFRSPALPAAPYIEYLRRRAAGGIGLIIAQPQFPNPYASFTEETLDRHRSLAEAVKAEGATVMIQLAHLGMFGRTDSDPRRPALWSFSGGQTDAGEAGHVMTAGEVELMVDAYKQAAVLAKQAGFDGVEVHGAHGYLIQQALTPRWNSRADEWGQDRTLFARRILAEVRDVMGTDGIVGYRTSTDDFRAPEDGGRGAAGIADDLARILGTGHVDLLNTTVGDGGKSYARAIPSYRFGDAPNVSFLTRLRELVDIAVPVIYTGRVSSPAVGETILQSGAADLVAMTRAHIADPDIVNKTAAGKGDRIRPCVGANVCVDRKLAGFMDISCFHNPEVLRETEIAPTPAATRRRVVVVGAGPAGLKAAEVAARRGHEVLLFDSARVAGGALRYAENTAAAALVAAVDHLVAELRYTDAQLNLGTTVDAAMIADLSPDEVILATGAAPKPMEQLFPDSPITARVLSSAEAMAAADVNGEVLVYDTVGTNEAALVGEALALRGAHVVFATRYETLAPYGGQMHRWVVPDVLRRRMDHIYLEALVGYVDGEVAMLVRDDGSSIADVKAPTIVAVTPGVPRLELADALTAAGTPFRLIGDAVAPRNAWIAFTEGQTAAIAL